MLIGHKDTPSQITERPPAPGAMRTSGPLAGTYPVDTELLATFIREMEQEVIPDIVRILEERAEARWRNIYGTEQQMHSAWRKRAEEAEAKLAEIRDGRDG